MQAHKATDALFTKDTKFTEDGIRLPLGGEGLWFGMSGRGTYRFFVPDVEAQQVAFIGTVKEDLRTGGKGEGNLVAIALRLKVVNGKISEAEQIILRPDNTSSVGGGRAGAAPAAPPRPGAPENIEKMGKPHPVYFETIPEAKRMTRDQYIKVANYYFSGLAPNDGTPTAANGFFPFTDDCVRFENGTITTARDKDGQPVLGACKKQFETGLKGIVDRVRDRRFVAVDRERGIVFAFGFFDHYRINWTWQIAELFKIEDGKIRRIEAAFHRAPFGINSGWSTYEQGISEEPRTIR